MGCRSQKWTSAKEPLPLTRQI